MEYLVFLLFGRCFVYFEVRCLHGFPIAWVLRFVGRAREGLEGFWKGVYLLLVYEQVYSCRCR